MPSGGAGIFPIPGGGVGIDSAGNANRRTVAISTGFPSVFERIVPDNVFCAKVTIDIAPRNNISISFFIFYKNKPNSKNILFNRG
jgi:hypothetical protein